MGNRERSDKLPNFQIEIDAYYSYRYSLDIPATQRWMDTLQEMKKLIFQNNLEIGHSLGEKNWTARHLANPNLCYGPFPLFTDVDTLPRSARNSYFTDLFGLSYFRFYSFHLLFSFLYFEKVCFIRLGIGLVPAHLLYFLYYVNNI
ncbi:unnamed protein product [Cuscuta epithymum]|uniref:Uncharacterized protein n=1 Tax=Cuscuta epithymum TaxID=186058 RepID=A0AAV0CSW0_9ASTE|nr:unnamed protein product [Cuscuta epithymum]